MNKSIRGFTLVELLIAIVVIAILASVSVVAFNGIQQRARDAQRENDVKLIARALEMYYSENGHFPYITGSHFWTGTYAMDAYTANTFVPSSWNELQTKLAPYINSIGIDPKKQLGLSGLGHAGRFGYEYSSNPNSERCNVPRRSGQTYTLFYKKESSTQTHQVSGTCTYLMPSGNTISSYTVVK